MQVIIDNGSNYVLAGKMLEMKRPKIYWTPCAAHCIDLMLEDIRKLPRIKMTIKRVIFIVGFIYSHSSALCLMRHFTKKREWVKHAVTRFATSFLSLERLYEEKANLRKMFVSDEWTTNKLSIETKGKEATKIVLMPSFWKNVAYTMKVMGPLVKVLRLVDSEKKAAMGYIYEAMDKAKEAIIKVHRPLHATGNMLNPEYYYANRSMKFDPKIIGGLHAFLHKFAPNTQTEFMMLKEMQTYKDGSGMFGSSTAIAMGQKWNRIHTKKRNKLDIKRMHDLVYVKYNQALKWRYNIKDEVGPISLNDIDECNAWLVGEMDSDDDEGGNERVFEDDDDDLQWDVVYRASGIGEPRMSSICQKIKNPILICLRGKAKKAKGGSSSSKKGKEKILGEVVEELDEEVDEGVDEEMDHGQSEEEAATFECNDLDEEEIEG
ncbi:PREDICTED: uncharacterized protein LOC109339653 [Lupinus angustifolius]|uniref:uncharacterized protein LOC109339653 n=1 Tax=Lupinus angustifolius TaxID=3871 RepID=UPI00092FBEB4|nr:PREDICTED: uncharacterized protein LOC109339653 [Lupinus angustifolius]